MPPSSAAAGWLLNGSTRKKVFHGWLLLLCAPLLPCSCPLWCHANAAIICCPRLAAEWSPAERCRLGLCMQERD
jgi:hypothetical protein